MKHTLPILTLLLSGAAAFAAGLSQLTLSISTQGPDAYADGTPVQVGEAYLLVYVAAGSTFQGVLTDGTLADPVNNRIATRAAAVAGAKCGFKAIQYPADLYPAGGSWVIVALDTRDAAGVVGGLVAAQGSSPAAAAASGESTSLNTLSVASQSGGAPVLATTTQSPAPAGTPAPVLTSVQAQDGAVSVRFKNVTGRALYEVQSTTDLASGDWQPASGGTRLWASAEKLVVGEGGASELPVTVQVPAADKVRFFRVIVPGSN
jgi:hypothetical protein